MNKRLYKFSELTGLGVSRETLRVWRKEDKDFPKPVYKKFYDITVFNQYLDRRSGIKHDGWEATVRQRMAQRGGQSELPR